MEEEEEEQEEEKEEKKSKKKRRKRRDTGTICEATGRGIFWNPSLTPKEA